MFPKPALDENLILEQADFWGIREKVKTELLTMRAMRDQELSKVRQLTELVKTAEDAKKHHNFRKDDGAGRIYCSDCGSRDMDSRWYGTGHGFGRCYECKQVRKSEEKYIDCKGCQKTVFYKKDLGWCHKCSLCSACQSTECPNDDYMSCEWNQTKPKTTKQLEEDLRAIKLKVFS